MTVSQEDGENVLSMNRNGLSHKNIAATLGIHKSIVTSLLASLRPDRPPRADRRGQKSKPDIVWVHPDNLGVKQDWELQGLCRTGGYDPDFWFPSPTEINTIKLVQRVCYRCPVIIECRTTAIARGEPNGIWGGLTELQRRRMRKAEKRRRVNEEREAAK
jgi:WhiB family redox-sensing transcriptional regulator